MIFANRKEAGQKLAEYLKQYQGKDIALYALPRGGVVVAAEIATAFGVPLDLIIARKIGHPLQPEFAIAAVSENGHLLQNKEMVETIDKDWFNNQVREEQKAAQNQREKYLAGLQVVPAQNKVAILVDNGIATGLTVMAAIKDLKNRQPQKTILAVPVVPQEIALKLRAMVDELVALEIPARFAGAVGAYFGSFPPVTDKEVIELLNKINQKL
ncbi:MAG TPA: phosphoribosyltransferase family protein [Clostridia bacterium]|nr:phosphoribosyltransferase family protein [Clostridia bacterium]